MGHASQLVERQRAQARCAAHRAHAMTSLHLPLRNAQPDAQHTHVRPQPSEAEARSRAAPTYASFVNGKSQPPPKPVL